MPEAAPDVVEFLWRAALALEDGNLSDALERLRQAQENLRVQAAPLRYQKVQVKFAQTEVHDWMQCQRHEQMPEKVLKQVQV